MNSSINEIKRTLAVLFAPGDTIEQRCVGNRTISGFYRDQDKLATDAQQLNSVFKPLENCYICLNPVQPELYGRRADQFAVCRKGEAVGDSAVVCRRWLLIDIDAVRPAGVSATDQQKAAAVELAKRVYTWLVEQFGSDSIVCADSGNGSHMLLRLADLPNDKDTRWTCERLLTVLADQFSNEAAKVDQATFNAARICTLYGSVKRKGSDIPQQPHRLSKLLHVPEQIAPLTLEQLQRITGQPPQAAQQPASTNGSGWDIESLLEQQQIEYSRDDRYQTADGAIATRWELEQCPWEPEHQNSACIIQFASGAVAAGCLGDRCKDKSWADLKQLWDIAAADDAVQVAVLSSMQAASLRPELLVVRSSDVEPEDVAWLWQDRFVIGGINLCCGRGGIGKTYFVCDLVARITNSELLAPNGMPLEHGRVLYSTGEDHISKIVEPRMQAHGVDRSRLEYIKGLPQGQYVRLLDVIEHCDLLRDVLRQRPDTIALVLDPISSFQGGADSNKVADVRRFTAVLTQLSEEFNIAVIGVHHFNKGRRDVAGDSISGSHAYRDAARAAWLFALDNNEPARRLAVCDKDNWAEQLPPGLAYRIEAGKICYEAEPLEMTSDELLGQASNQKTRDIASAWLQAQLSAGPQPAVDVQAAAAVTEISERTLRRAKKGMGVEVYQVDKRWMWRLQQHAGGHTSLGT